MGVKLIHTQVLEFARMTADYDPWAVKDGKTAAQCATRPDVLRALQGMICVVFII